MIKKILCLLLLVNTAYAQQVDTVYTDTTITIAFINRCEGNIDLPDTVEKLMQDTLNKVTIKLFHQGECILDNKSWECLRLYRATIVVRVFETKPKRKTNEKTKS